MRLSKSKFQWLQRICAIGLLLCLVFIHIDFYRGFPKYLIGWECLPIELWGKYKLVDWWQIFCIPIAQALLIIFVVKQSFRFRLIKLFPICFIYLSLTFFFVSNSGLGLITNWSSYGVNIFSVMYVLGWLAEGFAIENKGTLQT